MIESSHCFYALIYSIQRGYVRNVPGAPMCGCVERVSA